VPAEQAASRSPSRSTPLGAKSHPIATALDTVKGVVKEIVHYLGGIKPRHENIPLAVENLKTTAYALSLPTSGQLRLIGRMDIGGGKIDQAPDSELESVSNRLDEYNKLSQQYNQTIIDIPVVAGKRSKLNIQLEPVNVQIRKLSKEISDLKARQKTLLSETERKVASAQLKVLTKSKQVLTQENLRLWQECFHLDVQKAALTKKQGSLSLEKATKLQELDQALARAIQTPGTGRAGAFQALRNGLRDAETLRGLRTDWRYWEMLGVSPAEFDDVACNPEKIEEWLQQGFSAKEALSFQNAGWKPEQVLHLKGTGITGPLAKEIHRFGYTKEFFEQARENGKPVSLAQLGFVIGNHHDAWTENKAFAIGSGALNTPMQGHFMDHQDSRANSASGSVWVFKKEQYVAHQNQHDPTNHQPVALRPGEQITGPESFAGMPALGMNQFVSEETLDAPRLGARNVAAWRVAEKIGWPVIVQSEFSARTVPLTNKERAAYAIENEIALDLVPHEQHAFGIMMERVKGRYGLVNERVEFASDRNIDAKIRRNLVKLQLIDLILGQADRHLGNFLIDADGNVKGIDNDQCLPDQVNDPLKLALGKYPHLRDPGLRGLAMPYVIDSEMLKEMNDFHVDDLRQALRGLATQEEIEVAVKRLNAVKQWVNSPQVTVIDAGEWSSDEVVRLLYQEGEIDGVRVGEDAGRITERTARVDSSHYSRLVSEWEQRNQA
jgi:hypothetical protein